MAKLVLIDGHAIMYRAFHAIPSLTTPKNEPINAVYGLVSMLLRVIQELKPTHIAVVFDETEKTFRQKELPTYQAQRPPMADELSSQFSKAKSFLKAAKIPVYSKGGYEADDVIGTIASTHKVEEVVVVTGDRDMLQLVDDHENIKLFMPVGGFINGKLFGENETVERMGVLPNLIPDYKGLVGDASDNYFGVPGIGPKTAISLLTKYGSFENIYKNVSDLPEKLSQKLLTGEESARLSYKLATIIRDVPTEFNFEEMEKWKVNSPEVLELFKEFGFNTLTKRIQEVGKKIEDDKQMTLL